MKKMEDIKRSLWYKSRPASIQKAVEMWCLGDHVISDDEMYYIIGYSETEESILSEDPYDLNIIVSKINPVEDYEKAIENRVYFSARDLTKVIRH